MHCMSFGSDTSTSNVQLTRIRILYSNKYTIEQYMNDISSLTFCKAEILLKVALNSIPPDFLQ